MPLLTATEIRAARGRLSAADFPGTIRSHFPYWDVQYRPYLLLAVDALPRERFDWKPRPEMMTAHQMIVHIAEAECGWIDHVVDGALEQEWIVPAADPADGWKCVVDAPDHARLFALLEKWHQPTQRWLERPVAELARVLTRVLPDGTTRSYTLHWILDHVQEHEIHHRAQLNTYLRLMGFEPPSI